MTEFWINSRKKTIHARIELVGEKEAIEVKVSKYSIQKKGGQTRLVLEEASASREWLDLALKEFFVGRSIDLPQKAAAVMKLLT